MVLLYYIRPILWLLVGKKGVCNFCPRRIVVKVMKRSGLLCYYIISGLSCGCWLGRRECVISVHGGLW